MATRRDDLHESREAILAATLNHVPFDGWSLASLQRGAADAGLDDAAALRAFPRGVSQAIELHSQFADEKMAAALAARDPSSMRVRDRIAAAVKLRLEAHGTEREAIRRALTYLAQPQHGPLALRCLYRTVDTIWYAAGDTATDFNFYTKRALLAGVYGGTVLYWLNDKSDGFADTWRFLDRRIADVMRLPKVTVSLRELVGRLPSPFIFARAFTQRR